jgi:hypothetical protein
VFGAAADSLERQDLNVSGCVSSGPCSGNRLFT